MSKTPYVAVFFEGRPLKFRGVNLHPPPPPNLGVWAYRGEARVYRGTGVSRGVRPAMWERSLNIWELHIPRFEEFFFFVFLLGREHFGTRYWQFLSHFAMLLLYFCTPPPLPLESHLSEPFAIGPVQFS